jgi:hypothetical protein
MILGTLNLTVPVPCAQGYFGDRLATYMTQVKPSQIITLLGHDPQSKYWSRLPDELRKIYEYLQRKTSKGRREGPKRYIRHRIAPGSPVVGAFPPICVGVLKPLQFTLYRDKFNNPGLPDGIGELQFSLATSDIRLLLDGLSRVSGSLELLDEGKVDLADSFTFGLAIYAPIKGELAPMQLGQLFHDFNFLATPVSAGQAIDLDQSDPHIVVVDILDDAPVIKDNGGIEPRAASLGAKSTALVAKRVFLRFVRGATEGPAYLHTLREVPDQEAKVTMENVHTVAARIEHFLTQFANEMGHERFRQRDGIHLTAPGWNALAVIYHDMEYVLAGRLNESQRNHIITQMACIDWSRNNPDWIGLLGDAAINPAWVGPLGDADLDAAGRKVIDPTTGRERLGKLYGGQQAITKLVNYIRVKTGLDAQLKTAGKSTEINLSDVVDEEAA